jgi:Fur family ferric uptake transcriptional regulator
MTEKEAVDIIRKARIKVTKARVTVLRKLEQSNKPSGITRLEASLSEIHRTTLYRILQTFVKHGLAETCNIGHNHVDYRYASKDHFHYVVCDGCGQSRAIKADCDQNEPKNKKQSTMPGFSYISRHSITYFGLCLKCAGTED